MNEVTLQKKCIDFANVLKAFIGTGYISMPFAFGQSGLGLGIVILLLVGFLNDYGCVQIVKCKDIIVAKLIEQFESKYQSGLLPLPEAELMISGKLKSKLEDRITLGHIAKYAFGRKGQWVVTICLLFSQFGFCTAYIVFVGNTLAELINYSFGMTNSTGNSSVMTGNSLYMQVNEEHLLLYMLMVPIPLFILFSLLRTIRNMGWISMFANVAIWIGYITVMVLLIDKFSVSPSFKWVNFESAAVTFGMLTAIFEGIGTVIPIETSMIGNRQNFFPYLHVTIFLIIFMMGSYGIVGNLRYGSDTQQIILRNLPQTAILAVVNSILIVSVVCTYPLQMFPVVEVAEFLFFRRRSAEFMEDRKQILSNHHDILTELSCDYNDNEFMNINDERASNYGSTGSGIQESNNINRQSSLDSVYTKKQFRVIRIIHSDNIVAPAWKRNLIRIFIVFVQLALAMLMRNNFGYLSAFIGAIGSSFLCFILPAATHLKLMESGERKWFFKITNILIILFGLFGSVLSLIVSIRDIIRKSS